MAMDIYTMAVEQKLVIDHHKSDLYLLVTPESEKLVSEYPFQEQVTMFRSAVGGQMWYDVPFAYSPFWRILSEKKGV